MNTPPLSIATPTPQLGRGIYRLTNGPKGHIHHYHLNSPWSPDETKFLVLKYDKCGETADVEVIDLNNGSVCSVGRTDSWTYHNAAFQRWIGDSGEILFQVGFDSTTEHRIYHFIDEHMHLAPIDPMALSDNPLPTPLLVQRRVEGDRDRTGVMILEKGTKSPRLVCSLNRAITNHGCSESIRHFDLKLKMEHLHPQYPHVPWLYFKMCDPVPGPPNTTDLFVLNLENDTIHQIAPFVHHPQWHPETPTIVCFADAPDGQRRVVIHKIHSDDSLACEFTPYCSTTGHPSFDPTGRFILVDNYDHTPGFITIDVMDTQDAYAVHRIAQCKRTAYDQFGSPLSCQPRVDTDTNGGFFHQNYGNNAAFRIQAHPAWDRSGRFFAFNSDAEGVGQVYVADLAEYGLYPLL